MNFKFLFILSSILLLIFPGIIFKQWRLLLSIIPLLLFLSDRRASCNVHIERIPLPQRVIEGTKVEIVIKFQADSHPSFTFEVFDALPSGATIVEGSNRGIFSLKEKEEGKLRYVVELTRGHHVFGPLTFLFSNISGTHTEKCVVEQTVKTIVLTRFEEVRVPVLPKRHRSTVGIFPSRFVGRGREFFSVRNYYWGDEQRIINWKATARTGKLKSNDYESERAVDALIVVDAREEPFGQKVLDYSLAAALSCAYFLLREKKQDRASHIL